MAITKDKKRAIVAKVGAALREAGSVAFARFAKLSVKDATQLRRELAKEGVSFYVVKKSLLARALAARKYAGAAPALEGAIALVWTSPAPGAGDITAPARGVYEWGKKLKGALTLAGGVVENAFLDAAGITAIAAIPPLPVLRGMFVNLINSPRHRLVLALDHIAKSKT